MAMLLGDEAEWAWPDSYLMLTTGLKEALGKSVPSLESSSRFTIISSCCGWGKTGGPLMDTQNNGQKYRKIFHCMKNL